MKKIGKRRKLVIEENEDCYLLIGHRRKIKFIINIFIKKLYFEELRT